mgnify:CR=1 FL=1
MPYIGSGVSRFNTADSLTVSGTSTLSGNVSIPDSTQLIFGDGSDFKISHNGSKTKLEDTGTGNLEIRGTNIEFYSGDGGETLAKLTDDGAAELYHNNTKRIETTSSGVGVAGKIEADKASNPALSGVTNRNTILQLQNTDTGYVAGNATAIDFGTSLTAATASIIGRNDNAGSGYGGSLIFATSPTSGDSLTERVRILSGGGVDISAGNLVLDNGYGIDFSATANSSGTVTHEILDDYEIGTYQPTVDQGISGVSYSAQVGYYTKIGRVVYFLQHIDVASNSSRTGSQLQLGGLPFTSLNISNVWGSAWWVYTGGGYNLDTTHITWAIQGGTTRIIAYKNSGSVFTGSDISDANAGFHLAGFYYV